MPGLVLYDNPRSSNALKVRFLLAELAMPHERRTVDELRLDHVVLILLLQWGRQR